MSFICKHGQYNGDKEACGLCRGEELDATRKTLAAMRELIRGAMEAMSKNDRQTCVFNLGALMSQVQELDDAL